MTDFSDSRVWSIFEGKKKDGKIVKLRFQNLSLDRRKEALALINRYAPTDEAIHKATGIYKNEKALQEYRSILEKLFEENKLHVTICCVDDGAGNLGEIAGVSKVELIDQSYYSYFKFLNFVDVNTKEIQVLLKAANFLEETCDLQKLFGCHYHGRGIIVHPDYRGMGIANEFLRIRRIICQEQNIPMSSAWMTAKASQRAAEKNNWKTYAELEPREMALATGLVYDEDAVAFKLMYITIDN